MKIGFKNFKKFKDFPMIELAPITFLVGPNNSGKSSFIKALTFLLYNLQHGNKNFGKNMPFIEKVSFLQNTLNKFGWGDFQTTLHHNPVEPTSEIIFEWDKNNCYFRFEFGASQDDIKYAPELLVNLPVKEVSIKDIKHEFYIRWTRNKEGWSNLAKINTKYLIIWLERNIQWLRNRIDARQGLDIISHEYEDLEKWDRTRNHSIQERIEKKLQLYIDYLEKLNNYDEETIEFDLYVAYDRFQDEILNDYCSYELEEIRKMNPHLYDNFLYVEAHNANHSILLNINDKNDYLAQTVSEFYNSAPSQKDYALVYNWISEWLAQFEIGVGFEIIPHFGGETFTVDVIKETNTKEQYKVSLGTLGTGSIQLFILLLKIGTYMAQSGVMNPEPRDAATRVWMLHNTNKYKSCVIIVEEPEQNLHPKLQSKLAELFLNAYTKTNGRIQFVVETHSEYLIRRTQVMVAKMVKEKNISDYEPLEKENPFKVYYFPKEGLPYDMNYRLDGCFKNDFEPGFFDIAEDLALEIL